MCGGWGETTDIACASAAARLAIVSVRTGDPVVFQVVSPGPGQQPGLPSTLTACSFDSYNYAVVLMNWRQAVLSDNVVARSIRSAFDVDATSFGVQLVHNMVASVQPPPDAPTDWVRPMAAFYLDIQPAALTNNLAAGVADSGFVLRVRFRCSFFGLPCLRHVTHEQHWLDVCPGVTGVTHPVLSRTSPPHTPSVCAYTVNVRCHPAVTLRPPTVLCLATKPTPSWWVCSCCPGQGVPS